MIQPSSSKSTFELIRQAVASLESTERFTAQEALARYPELRDNPSALVDLAYEEYCQAVDRGDTIDQERFAAQFPEVEKSLLELLEVHSFVVGNSLLSLEEPEVTWPAVGQEFLGFELLEEIGRGAFARVFLARETSLGNRQVVVKVSQRGTVEASLLGVLDHPNIVPVHSIRLDEVAKLSALCMPDLGRTTATQWIQTRFQSRSRSRVQSPRHLRTVIEIGKALCQGLQFAHERDVLHCDVKPSNILLTHDGEPVLLDFNLSSDPSKAKYLVGGTLMYMAPEQLLKALGNREARVTAKTDVFCLGATLYEMATGEPAFPLDPDSDRRLKEVIQKALDQRREFSEKKSPLPEPFSSVLREALAFEPENRIGSARELFHRLAACEEKLERPRKTWLWPATITCLVAATAAAMRSSEWTSDSSPRTSAKQETAGGNQQETTAPPDTPTEEPPEEKAQDEIKELLNQAETAETKFEYQKAISGYRDVLAREAETPTFNLAERANVKHSLAFCLLMEGRIEEASEVLEELKQKLMLHESFDINWAACLTLSALDGDNPPSSETNGRALQAIRVAIGPHRQVAELHHAAAVFEALLGKPHVGQKRVTARRKALFQLDRAIDSGLTAQKALSLGTLLPEVLDYEPLSSLQKANPDLDPDPELDIPVQSPLTGKPHLIPVALP